MIPLGHKINYTKIKHSPYDCAECTYKKYGNEIKISDFVNAGREGTEAKKVIGKTVSISELKNMVAKIPQQKEIVNMNLDPYMANKIMKSAKISHDKIVKAEAEARAKAEAEAKAQAQVQQKQGQEQGGANV